MRRGDDTPLRCIIVGAGLGGLSAAIALRSTGHDVLVLEQADVLGTVGAGIQLAPNAARLLDRWGVIEQAATDRRARRGSDQASLAGWRRARPRSSSASGCCTSSARPTGARSGRTSTPRSSAPRPTRARDGSPVELMLDARVARVSSIGPARATVVLASGREEHADVVIGADGIRSAVRDSLFGAAARRSAAASRTVT